MNIVFLLFFVIGGIFAAYVCNSLLLRFSKSLGIRNKNDVTIRWSNQSKPSLGGVSFFVVFIFFSIAYSILFNQENIFSNKEFVGLFTAGTIAFAMGLADDAYNTRPLLKLFAQILCGAILVYTNTIIEITGNTYVNNFLTIFWVVLLMNSLNMLDNMDGITGTVVLFIIIVCFGVDWILYGFRANIWTLLNCAMIGGLLGFLYFNVNPSKLFMGDAGSQFIGFYIAFITIDHLWMVEEYNSHTIPYTGLFLIITCFAVPFSDTLTVVINRLRKGKSPMVGGKDHTTHHLVYAGLNDKKVWYVFLTLSFFAAIFSLIAVYLIKIDMENLVPLISIYSLLVFLALYRNTIKFPQK